MFAEAELQEYVDEIRKEVCSRCKERPEGGPPCRPLGKPCGVELHLPNLIDAVHEVHSGLIEPYLDNDRQKICTTCSYLHHCDFCPCPMDSLVVLVVEAIEAVDERHRGERGKFPLTVGLFDPDPPDMEEVTRCYQEAVGTWTGCDWPTAFGPSRLDLEGWSSAWAETLAMQDVCPEVKKAWWQAADWLREVERRAEQAEMEASRALVAANAGNWGEAEEHASRAWAIEFSTGRPLRHPCPSWHRFHEVIEAAAAVAAV
jgi:hypothetical protein